MARPQEHTTATKPRWKTKRGMMKLLRHGACMLGGRETLAMLVMLVWRRCWEVIKVY